MMLRTRALSEDSDFLKSLVYAYLIINVQAESKIDSKTSHFMLILQVRFLDSSKPRISVVLFIFVLSRCPGYPIHCV